MPDSSDQERAAKNTDYISFQYIQTTPNALVLHIAHGAMNQPPRLTPNNGSA